ncbi:MAG: hypothetical protein Q8O19_06680 [Rectinemataceae bacterium]|nr:hypothetical protein [Rectinemataceae bacterium]
MNLEQMHTTVRVGQNRANSLRGVTCKSATYNQWLASEIQASVDDLRQNISHDEVMAEMDADIAALQPVERT